MSDSYYDVAQICRSGHVVNTMAHDYPNSNQDFCDKCGSPTVMACDECNTPIRGHHPVPGVIGVGNYTTPAFCHKCGLPFPWTAVGLAAAEALADELDGLTADERVSLKKSLNDLVRETPATRVAETRFKKLMRKVGRDGYDGMRSILTDVVSETVRKTVFGQ